MWEKSNLYILFLLVFCNIMFAYYLITLFFCVTMKAYADYMGFILTLNEGVKRKKLTCEYKVSEVRLRQ